MSEKKVGSGPSHGSLMLESSVGIDQAERDDAFGEDHSLISGRFIKNKRPCWGGMKKWLFITLMVLLGILIIMIIMIPIAFYVIGPNISQHAVDNSVITASNVKINSWGANAGYVEQEILENWSKMAAKMCNDTSLLEKENFYAIKPTTLIGCMMTQSAAPSMVSMGMGMMVPWLNQPIGDIVESLDISSCSQFNPVSMGITQDVSIANLPSIVNGKILPTFMDLTYEGYDTPFGRIALPAIPLDNRVDGNIIAKGLNCTIDVIDRHQFLMANLNLLPIYPLTSGTTIWKQSGSMVTQMNLIGTEVTYDVTMDSGSVITDTTFLEGPFATINPSANVNISDPYEFVMCLAADLLPTMMMKMGGNDTEGHRRRRSEDLDPHPTLMESLLSFFSPSNEPPYNVTEDDRFSHCVMSETEKCEFTNMDRNGHLGYLVQPGNLSGYDTNCLVNQGDTGAPAPYMFSVLPGEGENRSNVLIYFQGGGADWDMLVADLPALSGLLEMDALNIFFARKEPVPEVHGFFNQTNPDNPFKTWTIIEMLYCTGDMHAGNRSIPDIGLFPTHRHHSGANNTLAVIDWIKNQPDLVKPEKLVMAGCSAGSLAVQVWATPLMNYLGATPANTRVIADSFVGAFPNYQDLNDNTAQYGMSVGTNEDGSASCYNTSSTYKEGSTQRSAPIGKVIEFDWEICELMDTVFNSSDEIMKTCGDHSFYTPAVMQDLFQKGGYPISFINSKADVTQRMFGMFIKALAGSTAGTHVSHEGNSKTYSSTDSPAPAENGTVLDGAPENNTVAIGNNTEEATEPAAAGNNTNEAADLVAGEANTTDNASRRDARSLDQFEKLAKLVRDGNAKAEQISRRALGFGGGGITDGPATDWCSIFGSNLTYCEPLPGCVSDSTHLNENNEAHFYNDMRLDTFDTNTGLYLSQLSYHMVRGVNTRSPMQPVVEKLFASLSAYFMGAGDLGEGNYWDSAKGIMESYTNDKRFYITGDIQHCFTCYPDFYERTNNNVKLVDWVQGLVNSIDSGALPATVCDPSIADCPSDVSPKTFNTTVIETGL